MHANDILMAGSIATSREGYHTLNTWHQPIEYVHHITHGKKPATGEVRHHLNHNKLDNRPCNLDIISRAEHALHHDDYKVGLDNGRKTMESNEQWLEARKLKNSELMRAYNKALPIIKALKHIERLAAENISLTADNYNLYAQDRKIYNVTKLTTLRVNYDLDFEPVCVGRLS